MRYTNVVLRQVLRRVSDSFDNADPTKNAWCVGARLNFDTVRVWIRYRPNNQLSNCSAMEVLMACGDRTGRRPNFVNVDFYHGIGTVVRSSSISLSLSV
jgi:hypothetical protein